MNEYTESKLKIELSLSKENWSMVSTAIRMAAGNRISRWNKYKEKRPELIGTGCVAECFGELGYTSRGFADQIDEALNTKREQ
jgi:hypothetical protein